MRDVEGDEGCGTGERDGLAERGRVSHGEGVSAGNGATRARDVTTRSPVLTSRFAESFVVGFVFAVMGRSDPQILERSDFRKSLVTRLRLGSPNRRVRSITVAAR